MGRTLALVLASVLATGLLPTGAAPQIPDLTWYLLNVATASEPTPVSGGGLTDDTRFRGMLDWARGEIRLEIAYEHTLGLWENDPLNSNLIFGAGGGAGDWLGLQGNISSWDGGSWDHRVDRLSLSLPLGTEGEITVGRQAVSWATTLFLTPADPFAPFDPADPFREYRIGVDAARVRLYPGPFSELDLVVRPSRQAEGTTLTALARGRRSVAGWDVSGWAGLVHDELGAAGGVSGSAGEWAVRGEASLRRDRAGEGVVLRLSTGVDRLLDLADRDLYVLAEYQHDGWGASSADSLLTVIQSAPFDRGEMQVLGMDTGLAQMSYQIHPLVAADGLVIVNLRDGSGLFAPGASWSVASDWSVRGGLYLGWGEGLGTMANPLGSEYGLVPAAGYLSLTGFF
jgi:hypothetical protein